MGNFIIPDRAMAQPTPLPPPDSRVAREEKIANNTAAESELKRFVASPQTALPQGRVLAIGVMPRGGA